MEEDLIATQKEVTVTPSDMSKYEGDEDPEFEAQVSGLADGDSEELISYTMTRSPGEEPGEYPIGVNFNKSQGNYTVTFKGTAVKKIGSKAFMGINKKAKIKYAKAVKKKKAVLKR
ncbi:MAG: hypothetical protein K6F55_08235 [Eubacterium sp.]|nr:hypothetical protein [Eubacterium sp.]